MYRLKRCIRFAWWLPLCFAAACFLRSPDRFVADLEGKGIVAVPGTSSFVTSSLLIADERKKSKLFDGFIGQQGMPAALSVDKEKSGKTLLRLYYLKQSKYFDLERGPRDWIVVGPIVLDKTNAKRVQAAVDAAGSSETEGTSAERRSVPRPPTPTVKKEDVVHEVHSEKETLIAIVSWYTGNAVNASTIARINDIKSGNALTIGQKIRIPSYLVTNTKPYS